MKPKNKTRRLAALLVLLCLLAVCALPAFATSANIKLVDKLGQPMTGTIRVRLYDQTNQKALSGGQLTIYKVAEVQRKNGNLSFEYCGDFDGCGIELGDLSDSTLADQLQSFLAPGAEGTVQTVDSDGYATFENLELGLYLVVQTKASSGYEAVNSFLVSLPMAEDGEWNYEVDASPKVSGVTPAPEEPDTPTPPPTTPEEPDTPETPENPDNPDTPVSPGNPDNPVAPGNPDSPVAPGNPDNPIQPGHPDNPVLSGLPQTGQLNWPVPVLAVNGLLLFAFGWALNRKEEAR